MLGIGFLFIAGFLLGLIVIDRIVAFVLERL